MFSSSIQLNDVVNSVRRMNVMKSAAATISEALLNVDFKVENRFCDAQELKKSYKTTKVPDVLLTFFSVLLNQGRAKLIRDDCKSDNIFDQHNFFEFEDEEDKRHEFSLKLKSLFQIMYCQVTLGKHKTPLHATNANAIYEKCMSRKLISAFNKQGTCTSYKSMKTQSSNLAKFTVYESLSMDVHLPSHFETQTLLLLQWTISIMETKTADQE